MTTNHQYCVIMAGGLGTRFWPVSRAAKPKQFLDFSGKGKSFLRDTYERMSRIIPDSNIIIITNEKYRTLVAEQVSEIPEENILLEPYNRNTAPCLAYASITLKERDPEAIIIATPADQAIQDTGSFEKKIKTALEFAEKSDVIISLGILPSRPDTNYGYIQVSSPEEVHSEIPVKVKTFTEKPDKEMADILFQSGDFLWNSGIFVSRCSVILDELRRYAPEIISLWDNSDNVEKIYTDCPRISFDICILEHTEVAMVLPSDFGWADIGNWNSISGYSGKTDDKGNLTSIYGEKLLKGSYRNIILSSSPDKLIAIKGLEDMIVIDTDDVLMICPRDFKESKDLLSELAMPEFEKFR